MVFNSSVLYLLSSFFFLLSTELTLNIGKAEDPAFHSTDERKTGKSLNFDDKASKPYFSSEEPIISSSTFTHSPSRFAHNMNTFLNSAASGGRSPSSFMHQDVVFSGDNPASPLREKPKLRPLSFLEYVKDEVLTAIYFFLHLLFIFPQ